MSIILIKLYNKLKINDNMIHEDKFMNVCVSTDFKANGKLEKQFTMRDCFGSISQKLCKFTLNTDETKT